MVDYHSEVPLCLQKYTKPLAPVVISRFMTEANFSGLSSSFFGSDHHPTLVPDLYLSCRFALLSDNESDALSEYRNYVEVGNFLKWNKAFFNLNLFFPTAIQRSTP